MSKSLIDKKDFFRWFNSSPDDLTPEEQQAFHIFISTYEIDECINVLTMLSISYNKPFSQKFVAQFLLTAQQYKNSTALIRFQSNCELISDFSASRRKIINILKSTK